MERLKNIIRNLGYRMFSRLRERVLVLLEELHNSDVANQGKPFNRNTCSKHWWFDFIKRFTDLKQLWELLPLERSRKKISQYPDGPCQTDMKMEEE